MQSGRSAAKTIAIIGGGVSGALTAYHLLLQGAQAEIIVIDPRPQLGLGLAYSTPSLRHLLNVPAGKISALPSEPTHFLDWLRRHVDAEATAETFAPRAVFGRYVQALLAKAQGVIQRQTSVLDLQVHGNAAILTLADGARLCADHVVLATGNFEPASLPGIASEAVKNGAYCHNAWMAETYQELAADAPITLIGTGLTGVDVLLRLRELGHRGTITAVSRHGIFPQRHTGYLAAKTSAIPKGTPATCVAYLRALRASIGSGTEWRAAVDSLRCLTNDLWLALPLAEQQRFRRHLQRRWDVVRHRMAPRVADTIAAELAAGTLILRQGHLVDVAARSGGATVLMHTPEGPRSLDAARVINCTGPSMNYRRVDSPLLASLFAQGLVSSGPLGGGLNSTRLGAILSASGVASSVLFNVGPGRLGTLLESIAIPEIRQQAVEIATILTGRVARIQDHAAIRSSTHAHKESAALVAAC